MNPKTHPHDESLRLALGAYALGTLDETDQHAVEGHLAGCSSCRVELESLLDAVPALSRLTADDVAPPASPPRPSADLFDRIARAVETSAPTETTAAAETRADEVAAARRSRVRRRAWLVAAAAAVVVAGTATGVAVTDGDSTTRPSPPAASGSARGIQLAVTTTQLSRGTTLSLTVRGLRGREHCHLVALARDGSVHDAGSWDASYDGDAHVVRTTDVARSDLRQLTLFGNGGRKLVDVSL